MGGGGHAGQFMVTPGSTWPRTLPGLTPPSSAAFPGTGVSCSPRCEPAGTSAVTSLLLSTTPGPAPAGLWHSWHLVLGVGAAAAWGPGLLGRTLRCSAFPSGPPRVVSTQQGRGRSQGVSLSVPSLGHPSRQQQRCLLNPPRLSPVPSGSRSSAGCWPGALPRASQPR